ncbi:ABC transporter substrate-binding protein [Actinomadura sp. 7K534]|uniref:ABC transporter substrate-binding protein n=1 Tax=Actinomadura sp. 7K534 TaxID=2530366 RepID=UPI00104F4A60|nr:ABC transporter substrate-binding protein [Actinomadura sp. 7K534]TDB95476.1 ABC transporter substrate-binding protein [Actinomadura sp. 7K534]
MSAKRARSWGFLAAVTTVAVTLTGCAAGGGESGGDAAAPGVDDSTKTVTLGGWRLASGAYASQNQTTQAVEACLKASNDAGGVNGWKFEYTANDTGGDPTRALQEVKSLVDTKKAFALLWGPGTPSNNAVLPYVKQTGVPYFPGMSGDPFVGEVVENVFPTIPPYSYQAMYMAQHAIQEMDAKKIALLYQNDDVGQSVHEVMAGFVKSKGAELVADVPHTATDTDYTSMSQKIAKAEPDAVIAWGYPNALVKTKAGVMGAGVDVPWFAAYYNANEDVVKLDPKTVEGTYFNYYLTPFFADTPAVEGFKNAMKKYYPDVPPSGLPLNGYASCQVFLEAFKEMTKDGAQPTWDGLFKALNGFEARQVGVVPSVTYSADKHTGPNKSYLIQIKDGDWKQVADATEMPTGQ